MKRSYTKPSNKDYEDLLNVKYDNTIDIGKEYCYLISVRNIKKKINNKLLDNIDDDIYISTTVSYNEIPEICNNIWGIPSKYRFKRPGSRLMNVCSNNMVDNHNMYETLIKMAEEGFIGIQFI